MSCAVRNETLRHCLHCGVVGFARVTLGFDRVAWNWAAIKVICLLTSRRYSALRALRCPWVSVHGNNISSMMSDAMSGDDAIDLVNSAAETQGASSDQTRQKDRSSMYGTWDVERTTEYRDKTHRGAWCNVCLRNGVSKDPKGHFFANIEQVLGHVKDCPHRSKGSRTLAAAELKAVREKKKEKGAVAGLKRSASSVSAGSSGVSSGSNKKNKTMAAFLPLADTGLSEKEQTEWELQLLRATISANLPLSSWDDDEFRKCFSSLRSELVIPSRRVMSTRILDAAAKIADDAIKKIVAESDGELLCMPAMFCWLRFIACVIATLQQ